MNVRRAALAHTVFKLKSDLPIITRNAVAVTDVVALAAFAF